MSIPISTALCLAASDFEALVQGRMIAAMSRSFINSVPHFALCPIGTSHNGENESIEFWASLESCRIYQNEEELEKLAKLTIWNAYDLKKLVNEQYKVFLVCLRVYRLAESLTVPARQLSLTRIGSFIKLPNYVLASLSEPVLSGDIFAKRKHQLENLEPPKHPELEELYTVITHLPNAVTHRFRDDLAVFLDWQDGKRIERSTSNSGWIQTITTLGNRSLEDNEGKKSNWRAGTDFEIVVRDSLQFLGFDLDTSHQGGAGGIDLYCHKPYALVGECKCGKSIPGNTVYELENLGDDHLDDFASAVKLIIGPGQPTTQLKKRAQKRNISIISPMALQKLVELQNTYPGCIDLIELKKYLEPGQIDHKINQYIDKVLKDMSLRSHIVQVVRECLGKLKTDSAGVSELHTAYVFSAPPCSLDPKELHEILLELASPLTGYLGRIKGKQWENDRFYFLRPFHLNTTT